MRPRPGRRRARLLALPFLLASLTGGEVALAGSMPDPQPTAVVSAAPTTDSDGDGLTDAFETTRSRTDPAREDSDLDGIHDSLEDPDRDLLSNLGEQHFGTHPRRSDTDGDGRDDWHEDSDRDRVADGRRQDAGPLPRGLRPSLETAQRDKPGIYYLGCHATGTQTAARTCTVSYGQQAGQKTVVLTGDSHAAHWFPALRRVAQEHGWRLVTITRPACPIADVLVRPGDTRARACSQWRRNVWAKVRSLAPDLVIATSFDRYYFRSDGRYGRDGAVWKVAVTRSLRQLRKSGATVLMLGDTYSLGASVISCLETHGDTDISRCQRARSHSAIAMTRRRDSLERSAAKLAGARFHQTRDIVCPNDPCSLVVDDVLVTRDGQHLTATYSRALWRALDRIIGDL
jgi:hypothetical protein